MRKVEVPDRWLVEEHPETLLGNKYSPVVVIVPHVYNPDGTRCEYCRQLLKVAVEAGACLAVHAQSIVGVEKLIANVLANPNVRWIIVTGHESLHDGGKILLYLHRYGIDRNRRVVKLDKPVHINMLSERAIERFRNQVHVIDLLINEDLYSDGTPTPITVQVGSRSFRVPVEPLYDTSTGRTEIRYVISRITNRDLPELLQFIIHSCLQEPENPVHVEVRGRYMHDCYTLYDPGPVEPLNPVELVKILRPISV